jgi:hypothetical protein
MKCRGSDAALNIYSKMGELNVKPDVSIYLLLVEIYAAKGQPDKMLEVYDIHLLSYFLYQLDLQNIHLHQKGMHLISIPSLSSLMG